MVVVYCYPPLTVQPTSRSVEEGVVINQRSPSLIFTSSPLCSPTPHFSLLRSVSLRPARCLKMHWHRRSSLDFPNASACSDPRAGCVKYLKALLRTTTPLIRTLQLHKAALWGELRGSSGTLRCLHWARRREWLLLCDFDVWKITHGANFGTSTVR